MMLMTGLAYIRIFITSTIFLERTALVPTITVTAYMRAGLFVTHISTAINANTDCESQCLTRVKENPRRGPLNIIR